MLGASGNGMVVSGNGDLKIGCLLFHLLSHPNHHLSSQHFSCRSPPPPPRSYSSSSSTTAPDLPVIYLLPLLVASLAWLELIEEALESSLERLAPVRGWWG